MACSFLSMFGLDHGRNLKVSLLSLGEDVVIGAYRKKIQNLTLLAKTTSPIKMNYLQK